MSENDFFNTLLVKNVEWTVGDPLQLLNELTDGVDLVASVLPFGVRLANPVKLTTTSGASVELLDDLGNMILAAGAQRLKPDGIGLFVIPPSFFFSPRSVFQRFDDLGIGFSFGNVRTLHECSKLFGDCPQATVDANVCCTIIHRRQNEPSDC